MPPIQTDLDNDWRVIQARAAEAAGIAELERQLRALRERAIIDFGDIGLAGLGGFGLDPSVAALVAQANAAGTSTTARLAADSRMRRKAIVDQLAGSGMINSGDTGYFSGEEDKRSATALFDARQAVLAALRGAQAEDLTQRQGLRQGVVNALNEAYTWRIEHPELFNPAPTPLGNPAHPPPGNPAHVPHPIDVSPRMPEWMLPPPSLANRPRALPRPRRDRAPYRFRSTGRGY